ncbi:MAG TPA: amidohydrolase [Paludibaculum sp.]|jgi:5-methylthioadenosine/S-adenosylhomocysteine deaminase
MQLSWTSFFLCAALAAAPADLIVSAGKVVTMDGQRRVISNGAVAIAAGRILAVGPRAEIDRDYQAKHRIDRPDSILTPGLINTHTHAPMSLLRGIADDLDLQEWLTKFIFPAEGKNVNVGFVRAGTRLAVLEMMLGGTTTYTDMYYFEDAIADETKKAGMRGVLGQTIIGFPVSDYKTPQAALAGAETFIQKFKNDPLITPAVAPHAIYTNSPETLKAARALADKYVVPYIIHVSETKKENDDCAKEHGGATPTAYLESLGVLNTGRTLFAHSVWSTPADIAILKTRHVGVAHCPSSNMKLGSGAAPIAAMLDAGVNVGLGPDGPAGSNNDFDMFEEMDLAAKLAKVTSHDPKALPATRVFEMATLGGARALGMEKEIGSLEPGKRADLITVSQSAPNAWPAHDVYSMLVFALKASDVQDVIIEGRPTVENKRPLTLNPIEVRKEAAAIRAKVDASLK